MYIRYFKTLASIDFIVLYTHAERYSQINTLSK